MARQHESTFEIEHRVGRAGLHSFDVFNDEPALQILVCEIGNVSANVYALNVKIERLLAFQILNDAGSLQHSKLGISARFFL